MSKQPIDTIIEAVVSMIRSDERIKSLTDAYRASHEKAVKESSPTFGVAAVFHGGKRQADITSLTGISLVDIDHISAEGAGNNEECIENNYLEHIRERIKSDPHTLLCYTTISGEGIRILFRYELDESFSLTQQLQYYPRAFAAGNAYYSRLLGVETDGQCKNVGRVSGLAHDPDVYYNPDAVTFTKEEIDAERLQNVERKRTARRASQARGVCARLKAQLEQTERFEEGNHHNFLVKLIFAMARHHVSAADARAFLEADFADYHGEDYDALVRSCYGSCNAGGGDEATNVELIIDFLHDRNLRYDALSRKIQAQTADVGVWSELTERGMNDLYIDCNKNIGKNVNYQDFRHVLNSGVVPEVNPLREYIFGLPEWDGVDYIGAVARMVRVEGSPSPALPVGAREVNSEGPSFRVNNEELRVNNEELRVNSEELGGGMGALWERCFRKWFVAMVASWMTDEVVNHQVLVLIGEQGIYKTTWLDALMPPELVQYRCRQSGARALDKDEQLRATEFGLINMDEIDRMSEQELNALKSLITASDINVRAAYAQTKERRLRVASYVASGNKERFLTDTTGNRRWLPFHVTAIASPFEHPLPYAGMYAQAWALVRQGFNYWFNITDIRMLNTHVDTFMVETNEEQLLPVYFQPCQPDTHGAVLLTVAEISAKLTLFGNIRRPLDIRQLGSLLRKLGYQAIREKNHGRRGFLVRELPADTINAQRQIAAISSIAQ